MKNSFWIFLLLGMVMAVATASSYTIFLKNGKSVQGALVDETGEMIVLQDAFGIKMNFKKSNVDLEKTEVANQNTKPAESVTVSPAGKEPVSSGTKPAGETAKPKAPARVITEEDLEKLRKKYDLGEGLGSGSSVPSEESQMELSESPEKTEDEWKKHSRRLENQLRQAESTYNLLKQECEEFKGISIQTHTVVDENGQVLDMVETTRQVCEDAEMAKTDLEEARSEREAFEKEAREAGAAPGWIRTENEK